MEVSYSIGRFEVSGVVKLGLGSCLLLFLREVSLFLIREKLVVFIFLCKVYGVCKKLNIYLEEWMKEEKYKVLILLIRNIFKFKCFRVRIVVVVGIFGRWSKVKLFVFSLSFVKVVFKN